MPPESDATGEKPEPGQLFTWDEIGLCSGKGNAKERRWLVIHRKVYDISQFHWRHPGGTRVISHYAGQDATDAFSAFHKDEDVVKKYLSSLLIGELAPDQPSCEPTKNIQYGFLQHDLGHISVFQKTKWNRLAHFFVMGVLKGGPASQWNHMHNQHHAKPNCFRKDPDLNMHPLLFSLGKPLSVELGKKKKKYMPYQYQHKYFCLLAPLTFTIYVQLIIFRFAILRKKWMELAFILAYNLRVCLMYVPFMGFKSFMAFYWLARFLESNWFLWVSQMNHIPMNIDYDQNLDWVSAQLAATCNVDQSWFNDWYTGHLNFQIEHHLFPTMPRHNYWKVAPLVKSLCDKHGVNYQCKPLLTAFADIVRSLKKSGEYWQDAYLHG